MRILIAAAVGASLAFSSLAQTTPPRAAGVTRVASSTLVNGKPDRDLHADQRGRRRGQGDDLRRHHHLVERAGSVAARWPTSCSATTTRPRYLKDNSPYFGAIVGRYGNRIAKAQFALDGRTYALAANNGVNHLHGGTRASTRCSGRAMSGSAERAVAFSRTSLDGEEGYPGTLEVRVTYTLTDKNELVVAYEATTDKPTADQPHAALATSTSRARAPATSSATSFGINADRYTPVDETLIPTGELAPVDKTPFDFRKPTAIGARIKSEHPQMQFGRGYDHNWVLARSGAGLSLAADVHEPKSGRTLQVRTTEPGLQFYTGNFLDGTLTGKDGRVYRQRYGFCLETQHFPDSPNKPTFPSTTLRPGDTYRSRTVFTTGGDSSLSCQLLSGSLPAGRLSWVAGAELRSSPARN